MRTRLYELDLLRFAAALAVMAFHFFYAGNATDDMQLPIPDTLEAVSKYGYLGVDLFFVLSGFVISLGLEQRQPGHFATGRLFRLYPAFFAAVIFTATARNLFGGIDHDIGLDQITLNLTLFAGILEPYYDIEFVDGVYWSLMAELQFYFLIWLVLLFRQAQRLESIALGWLAITLASDWVDFPNWLDQLLLLEWSPWFVAGILFQRIYQSGASVPRLIGLSASLYLMLMYTDWRLEIYAEIYQEAFSSGIVMLVISLIFVLFTLLATNNLRFLRHPWLLWLGALTYPLYLMHQEAGYILFRELDEHASPEQLMLWIPGIMLLLALTTHLLVERPIQALRQKNRSHSQTHS